MCCIVYRRRRVLFHVFPHWTYCYCCYNYYCAWLDSVGVHKNLRQGGVFILDNILCRLITIGKIIYFIINIAIFTSAFLFSIYYQPAAQCLYLGPIFCYYKHIDEMGMWCIWLDVCNITRREREREREPNWMCVLGCSNAF